MPTSLGTDQLERKEMDLLCERIRNRYFTEYFYVRLVKAIQRNPPLALYLPFVVLKQAPNFFRAEYRYAWESCFSKKKAGSAARHEILIHRASQLIPWLIRAKIYRKQDLEHILALMQEGSIEYAVISDGLAVARRHPDRGNNDYHPYAMFYNDHARAITSEIILRNM